jgi:flagellar hook-basal body complex protein FliE
MDLKLKPFDFAQAAAKAGLRPDGTPLLNRAAQVAGAIQNAGAAGGTGAAQGGFQAAMAQALKGVSESQLETQRLQRELQLGNPTVSLEETMVAMQKSQVGFQAVISVRNRMVQAYSEIMNMQV